ncbi:MAG: hypothetical protein GZ088_07940 [Acidipila sp.]|nr:hypothetical protein [Acidipila sp.]
MKFPNWFKLFWWSSLLLAFSSILIPRYKGFVAGQSTPVDLLLSLVWVALLLLPLFQEISLFGVSLKKEIESLKSDFKKEVTSLRADIRNSVDVRAQISPNFIFPTPPPDSQLPAMEKRLNSVIEDALKSRGVQHSEAPMPELTASEDARFMFGVRFSIERELRRIRQHRMPEDNPSRRFVPTLQLARWLADSGLIDRGIEGAIREVWFVASPAIHGEPVTPVQVAFVRDLAPRLVAALRAIES